VEVRHDGLLTAGQPWGAALAAMLESSDAVVAIIGTTTATSHHQSAEIERALQFGKLFIPVFVDHFTEPQAALAFMAANLDRDGRIRYLADCTPDETTAVLRTSAQRIVAALAGNSASAAGPSHNQAGSVPAAILTAAPDTLLTLTITMRAPGRLDFVALDARGRVEWSHRYQPKLIESVTASLQRSPWNVDAARTLSSLLLPAELRTLVSQAPGIRLHLVVDPNTAGFPWEVVFGLASGSVVPVSVVRKMHGAARPPVRRPGAAAAALLISNPSTRGARTGLGSPIDLPLLPGTEVECRAVEAILRRVGFTVTHSTGESATEVIGAFLRTDYRIVLIAAHGLHEELQRDGTTAVGIPLSDGAMLGAGEFEQLRQPPELVFIDAARLARVDSIASGDEAEMPPQPQPDLYSLPARLLQTGVRAVIALDSDLDDAAATDFCTTFFASATEPDQTVEQAMLAARRQAYARHPETGVWSTYQIHGAAEYRIDALSFEER